jgi:uncharacterized protein
MDLARTIREGPHPVSAHERIDLIDVVRGFALFGVLIANLVWITTDVVLTDARLSQLPTAPLDRIVKPLVVLFVDHKFYTLFSFLFGLGFAIQLSRAKERGYNVVAVYARRVSILAASGSCISLLSGTATFCSSTLSVGSGSWPFDIGTHGS